MRSRARYAAYIFDLDGTLFDIPVDWRAVRKDLTAICGVPMEGVSIFSVIKELTFDKPSLRGPLFVAIDVHEVQAAGEASPIDGALEIVRSVSKASKLGLVTMQGKAACSRILGRYGLLGDFRVVMTREDSLDRSEQLLAASSALGESPEEVLFVGDKMNDLAAGRKARTDVALVGRRAKEEWRPDYLFPELKDLRSLLP